jgi:hypothetical protein
MFKPSLQLLSTRPILKCVINCLSCAGIKCLKRNQYFPIIEVINTTTTFRQWCLSIAQHCQLKVHMATSILMNSVMRNLNGKWKTKVADILVKSLAIVPSASYVPAWNFCLVFVIFKSLHPYASVVLKIYNDYFLPHYFQFIYSWITVSFDHT